MSDPEAITPALPWVSKLYMLATHLRGLRAEAQLYATGPRDIRWIVVHRCTLTDCDPSVPDAEFGAVSMALTFAKDASLHTGKLVPYHLVVRTNGECEQALPLEAIGMHASGLNMSSVGIAVVGETREANPAQLSRLLLVVRELLRRYPSAQVIGHCRPVHDGMHGPPSRSDPGKICPEPVVKMEWVLRELMGLV